MLNSDLRTHLWTGFEPRKITIEGKSILHQHCRECGRDFARESNRSDWKAVYIGAFSLKFLEDSVTQQWISEPCRGSSEPSPSEIHRARDGVDANRNQLTSFNAKPVLASNTMAPRPSIIRWGGQPRSLCLAQRA